jgi:hypothetical protein
MGGEIRNPKSEIRRGEAAPAQRGGPLLIRRHSWFQNQPSFSARPAFKALALGFGFRISDFGLLSDFGFRASDFPLPPVFSLNLMALQAALPTKCCLSRVLSVIHRLAIHYLATECALPLPGGIL